MTPRKVRALFERLAAANPAPTTELEYRTPYQLLVAVILSAQATDKSVNLATRPLFARAGTPQDMVKLGEEGLKEFINRIGLYKTKAKNVVEMSRLLLDRHEGSVPHSREALEALPGVGRKTASVILNTIFGDPAIAVDTHVFRLANRTRLAPGKDVREVEDKLLKAVPPEYRANAHHWLILHGRYVCKAARPDCANCVIRDLCEWPEKNAG
jgi:endonuclease-3